MPFQQISSGGPWLPHHSEHQVDGILALPPIESLVQTAAIKTAISKTLTMVHGRPGTGKSWTAATLIAAILKLGPAMRVSNYSAPSTFAWRLAKTSVARERNDIRPGWSSWPLQQALSSQWHDRLETTTSTRKHSWDLDLCCSVFSPFANSNFRDSALCAMFVGSTPIGIGDALLHIHLWKLSNASKDRKGSSISLRTRFRSAVLLLVQQICCTSKLAFTLWKSISCRSCQLHKQMQLLTWSSKTSLSDTAMWCTTTT